MYEDLPLHTNTSLDGMFMKGLSKELISDAQSSIIGEIMSERPTTDVALGTESVSLTSSYPHTLSANVA